MVSLFLIASLYDLCSVLYVDLFTDIDRLEASLGAVDASDDDDMEEGDILGEDEVSDSAVGLLTLLVLAYFNEYIVC